jgi:hypothetical protein
MVNSQSPKRYLINPSHYSRQAEAFVNSFDSFGISAVTVSGFGEKISSDFNERGNVTRQDSLKYIRESLGMLNGYDLIFDYVNAYVLPFAHTVKGIPMISCGSDITDESVPFLHMVLSGKVNYVSPPLNMSGFNRSALLRLIETGTGLHYIFTHAPSHELKDTDYSMFYSTNFDDWHDDVYRIWDELKTVLPYICGREIVSHSRNGSVTKTVFANGAYVLVNHGNRETAVDGHIVGAQDFIIGWE